VLITNEFHEFCWFTISETSDDGKASYGQKSMHIFIMSEIRHSHRQYDTRGWCGTKHGLNRAKVGLAGPTSLVDWPGFDVFSKTVSYTCQERSVEMVSDAWNRWCLTRFVGWPHVRPAGRPSAPKCLKLAVEILLTSYKYPHIPFDVREIRKWGLASYSAPKFILCRVERGNILRARGLPGLSGVLRVAWAWKLCQNPFGLDGVFWALVWSSVGALLELCEFWQRTDSQVPLMY
jgi:hypothetical protein